MQQQPPVKINCPHPQMMPQMLPYLLLRWFLNPTQYPSPRCYTSLPNQVGLSISAPHGPIDPNQSIPLKPHQAIHLHRNPRPDDPHPSVPCWMPTLTILWSMFPSLRWSCTNRICSEYQTALDRGYSTVDDASVNSCGRITLSIHHPQSVTSLWYRHCQMERHHAHMLPKNGLYPRKIKNDQINSK